MPCETLCKGILSLSAISIAFVGSLLQTCLGNMNYYMRISGLFIVLLTLKIKIEVGTFIFLHKVP